MRSTTVKIQCVNPNCQVSNLESENFCSGCRTPVLKRYLWGIGEMAQSFKIGELVGDRYLVKQPQLFLDTKPDQRPDILDEIPAEISPYLLLLPYHLHIPQLYGLLPNALGEVIWLLEYNYLPPSQQPLLKDEQLFFSLTEVWSSASPLRQLNWLWQMATLWQPLLRDKAAASLLNPSFLKTRGQIFQLQELDLTPNQEPKLADLGSLWAQWVETSSPQIRDFLAQLCEHLQQGQIQRVKKLVSILDQATYQIGKKQEREYQIYALTDAGPSRDHNEDNCYPPEGNLTQEPAIAIVCDGLGGQDGGEIASQLAVDFLQEQLSQFDIDEKLWRPEANLLKLDEIIRQVNDQISDRNDQEKRKERQRMGTTLIMAIAKFHELYFHYIGDSRIYLITKDGAYQLTVDDDLASREVRLGYAIYRDAIQYPNSGALIQALGMASSNGLHINRKRLILDEDYLLLLCSDGLSDKDRVEQYWDSQILPILTQGISLATVGNQLLEIANEKNGHDNTTIALFHCQVIPPRTTTNLVWSEIKPCVPTIPPDDNSDDISLGEMPTVPIQCTYTETVKSLPSPISTQESKVVSTSSQSKPLIMALLLAIVAGLGALGWYLFSLFGNNDNPTTTQPPTQPDRPPDTPPGAIPLVVEDIIKLNQDINPGENKPELEATTENLENQIAKDSCWEVIRVGQSDYEIRQYSEQGQLGSKPVTVEAEDLKDKYTTIHRDEAEKVCLQSSP